MFSRIAVLLLCWGLLVSPLRLAAADRAWAAQAAQASADLRPGDDIVSDYRGEHVHVADLDESGREEVVYVLAATCASANFDCPNQLTVMTALEPGDSRGWPVFSLNRHENALFAELRRNGYADDASVQIPGEVQWIRVAGNRLAVRFIAELDSPNCLRTASTTHGRVVARRCPEPGAHTYEFTWTPGTLVRIQPPPGPDDAYPLEAREP